MKNSILLLKWVFLLLIILIIFHLSIAKVANPKPQPDGLNHLLNKLADWREQQKEAIQKEPSLGYYNILVWLLCFLTATISSAGGVGGGTLYIPILNLVAGLDLKTATSYSAFMVTGVFLSNVLYYLFFTSQTYEGNPLINYDIALLSQPCMLLGVSLGVVCNIMFPEWLITALFALFLAYSTYKTCKVGLRFWRAETEVQRSIGLGRGESAGGGGEVAILEPLLSQGSQHGMQIPWKYMIVLSLVWTCFFLLHLLRGDKHGQVRRLLDYLYV